MNTIKKYSSKIFLPIFVLAIMIGLMAVFSSQVQVQSYYEVPQLSTVLTNLPSEVINGNPTTSVKPCTPDCSSNWVSTVYNDFIIGNGCIIRVFYTCVEHVIIFMMYKYLKYVL